MQLKKYLILNGIGIKEFSKKSGVCEKTLRNIFNGKGTKLHIRTMLRISKATEDQVSFDD